MLSPNDLQDLNHFSAARMAVRSALGYEGKALLRFWYDGDFLVLAERLAHTEVRTEIGWGVKEFPHVLDVLNGHAEYDPDLEGGYILID